MKYHRIVFIETPERILHAISSMPDEGFQLLTFKAGPDPAAGITVVEIKKKEQQIENSPYLKIAETK